MTILFKDGYKYQLVEPYSYQTPFRLKQSFAFDWVSIYADGTLFIEKGYAWDGATGIWDSPDIIRGSLIHDALYQLIRLKVLPYGSRETADKILRDVCLEDGMNQFKARLVYKAVRLLGKPFANNKEKPAKSAP